MFSPGMEMILPESKSVWTCIQNTYADVTAVSMVHSTDS